jgi:hypothetical protein
MARHENHLNGVEEKNPRYWLLHYFINSLYLIVGYSMLRAFKDVFLCPCSKRINVEFNVFSRISSNRCKMMQPSYFQCHKWTLWWESYRVTAYLSVTWMKEF